MHALRDPGVGESSHPKGPSTQYSYGDWSKFPIIRVLYLGSHYITGPYINFPHFGNRNLIYFPKTCTTITTTQILRTSLLGTWTLWVINGSQDGYSRFRQGIHYSEGQGDLVSRLITSITHIVTLIILILILLTKSP